MQRNVRCNNEYTCTFSLWTASSTAGVQLMILVRRSRSGSTPRPSPYGMVGFAWWQWAMPAYYRLWWLMLSCHRTCWVQEGEGDIVHISDSSFVASQKAYTWMSWWALSSLLEVRSVGSDSSVSAWMVAQCRPRGILRTCCWQWSPWTHCVWWWGSRPCCSKVHAVQRRRHHRCISWTCWLVATRFSGREHTESLPCGVWI